jgi:hypothetical protein
VAERADRSRVQVAHTLALYAEPLAVLLAERRPRFDVRRLDPAELDEAIAAAPGAIVVTDRLTPAIERHAGGWLLYYSEQENVAIAGGQGAPRRIEVPWFADTLAAIDRLVARRFPAARRDCLAETADTEWEATPPVAAGLDHPDVAPEHLAEGVTVCPAIIARSRRP